MPNPAEHKIVQARNLGYAEAIDWTFVPREKAEQRRGFDPDAPPAGRSKNRSLFFDDQLDSELREFNPRPAGAEHTLLGAFRQLHTDIDGNRVDYASGCRGSFFRSLATFATETQFKRQNNEYATNKTPFMSHIVFM